MNSRISHRLVSAACVLLILFTPDAFAQPPSTAVVAKEYTWKDFEALNEQTITKMQLDDPLLRAAYKKAMSINGDGKTPDWMIDVFQDIRRRGNSAIPLLFSLFQDKQNLSFCTEFMEKIDDFGFSQAEIEPFVNYARTLAREKGRALHMTTIYGIATMLSRHGTNDDIHILEQLDFDPKTGAGVDLDDDIRRLKERLAKEEKQRK